MSSQGLGFMFFGLYEFEKLRGLGLSSLWGCRVTSGYRVWVTWLWDRGLGPFVYRVTGMFQ